MSKGKRKRLVTEQRKQQQEQFEAEKAVKHKKNKTIAVISISIASVISAILILGLAAALVQNAFISSGRYMRKTTAVKSENYEVTEAMLAYKIGNMYQTFVSYYGDYISYTGLDTEKSLASQEYQEGQTWLEYFASQSKSYVKTMLILNEAAKANGVALTAAEIANIENIAENKDLSGYAKGISARDVADFMKLDTLAAKYKNTVISDADISDEAIESYYEANKADYTLCSYRSYAFTYGSDKDFSSADEAKSKASELQNCNTENEFIECLTEYLKLKNSEISDNDLQSELDQTLNEYKTAANTDENISEWAFDGSRELCNTYIFDNDSDTVTVYMLTSLPSPDKRITKDVRHILLTADTYDDNEEKALQKAEEILNEWNSGDKTEETFALLAEKYTEDIASAVTGGLYENVYQGEMSVNFNDWCFDESRKIGDVDIVATNYGEHIIYFVGDGMEKWKADVIGAIKSEYYSDKYSELSSLYSVQYSQDAIDDIKY